MCQKKPRVSRACVWTIWKDVKLLLPILPVPSSFYFWHGKKMLNFPDFCRHYFISFQAGGTGPLWIPVPMKLFHNGGSGGWSPPCTCKFPIYRQWQPAKPRTGTSNNWFLFLLFRCTVVAICQLISFSTGHGDDSFSMFLGSFHRPIPVRYNWSVFARKIHSTSKFAMTVLSKCVIHAGFVKVAWTLRGMLF